MPDILAQGLILVNDSLTGLEPRAILPESKQHTLLSGAIRRAARKSDIYLYKGTPYFIDNIGMSTYSFKYRKWSFSPDANCEIFYNDGIK
ncbi:hypothetical protein HII27_26935 [Kluyvera sp. SCKS090646]|uniref:Uncharacterized protein n=4 Tax=Kluyvera sichuanensis TaxID=2725494 RepID=A0ABR6S1L6_9ENTR|nr:hypothetical protein [Kluyvera sichuanensis]